MISTWVDNQRSISRNIVHNIKHSEINATMRSEQEVKNLLRHAARSLQPAGLVESVAGNTSNDMSTTIAAALVLVTPFE
ncbi:predicted protein [Botrytis cinerea T4]|uniref:Uncharacterized protein n=1 Tax=Botryotinia fuckeliana (strain T4) TaxID=999810 RepID=G2YMV3_BOTF4|nr:predicted protein [Botrytis cinerea T4]